VSSGGSEHDKEPDAAPACRLERVLLNAARQGDERGAEAGAIAVLDAGLARYPNAPMAERVPLLVYRVELLVRTGDRENAAAALAEIHALHLDEATRTALASDLAAAAEFQRELEN
jgi:hypothetical protein